jgi:hypothetical protein
MNQRHGTASQFKISKSASPGQDLPANRELKYCEHYLERTKQIYSKKYKLDPMNVYEKMFTSLNHRIKTEIEGLCTKSQKVAQRSTKFKIGNYSILYRNTSLELLRMLKKTSVSKLSEPDQENGLVWKVRAMGLQRAISRDNESTEGESVLPKLYDFNENLKFDMKQRRNLKAINSQVRMMNEQLAADMPKGIRLQMPQPLRYNRPRKEFTRNAFLASLNYCFDNPII